MPGSVQGRLTTPVKDFSKLSDPEKMFNGARSHKRFSSNAQFSSPHLSHAVDITSTSSAYPTANKTQEETSKADIPLECTFVTPVLCAKSGSTGFRTSKPEKVILRRLRTS